MRRRRKMRDKARAQMPEPLSYLDRPISLAALSIIELTPPEMVTALSLAGYRYIS